ncbi:MULTISPECIES: hypothetical protein [Bacteria]|uniref:hypothetical protein n=1 Tax=Bacteria TaxID=2 RepID=UPI003C7B6054
MTTKRWMRTGGAWAAALAVVAVCAPIAHASSAEGVTMAAAAGAAAAPGGPADDESRDRRSARDPWMLVSRNIPVVKTGDPKNPLWVDERCSMPMRLSLGGKTIGETLSMSLTHNDRGKAFSGHIDSSKPGSVPMWIERTAPMVTNVTDVERFVVDPKVGPIMAENMLGGERRAVYAKGTLTLRETFVDIDSRSDSSRTAHSLDISINAETPFKTVFSLLKLEGGYTGTWEKSDTQVATHHANLNAETTLEIEWLIVPAPVSQNYGDLYMKIL